MGIFSESAEISLNQTANANRLSNLPSIIHQHTDLSYSCKQEANGCVLKPLFRDMPYRNSFIPEIKIHIYEKQGQTVLHAMGQPTKSVRIIASLYLGFAAIMQLCVIIIALTSGLSHPLLILLPFALFAFCYCLCKLGTKLTFQSIMKAIRKEFS